jgi:hypothetical protein
MVKKIFAFILLIAGFSIFIIFGFELLTSSSIQHTIEHNKEYKKSFQVTASKVDEFIKTNQRLPSIEEFKSIDTVMTINSSATEYPKEWEVPPTGAYFLARWTGDNDEFYASWNHKTTLLFDEDSYYLFHSKLLTWILTIAGATSFILGLRLLKLKKNSNKQNEETN